MENTEKELQLEYGEVKIRLDFAIGDIVYFMYNETVHRGIIKSIELTVTPRMYTAKDEKSIVDGSCVFDDPILHEEIKISFSKLFKLESELFKSIGIGAREKSITSLYSSVAKGCKEPNKGKPFHKIISDAEELAKKESKSNPTEND